MTARSKFVFQTFHAVQELIYRSAVSHADLTASHLDKQSVWTYSVHAVVMSLPFIVVMLTV